MNNKDNWFQKDKPLWLPEGSVRAILALAPTATMLGIIAAYAFGQITKDAFSSCINALGPYAGGAFIYYFKLREAASKV